VTFKNQGVLSGKKGGTRKEVPNVRKKSRGEGGQERVVLDGGIRGGGKNARRPKKRKVRNF